MPFPDRLIRNPRAKVTSMRRSVIAVFLAASVIQPSGAQTPRDTLVVAQSVDVESLEPAGLNATGSHNVASHLFATLLDVTSAGELVPVLATSWRWNEAGTALTFTIREGWSCEDGAALTAADVAYSLNRAADPELKLNGHLSSFVYRTIGFERAEATSATEVTVRVKNYQSITPGMLARGYLHCEGSYRRMSKEEAATRPVASGPYRLREWLRDDRVVLTRNPAWRGPAPGFETVVWRVVPEASTRAAELIAGGIDIAANVLPDQAAAIGARNTATVKSVQGTRRIFVGFNFTDRFRNGAKGGEAIHDRSVRQALNLAVDVPTICAQLLGTECARANGPANLGNQAVAPYPYDPRRAEAMLDAAGFRRGANGVRFELTLQGPRGRYLADVSVVQAVAQYLSDIGVDTRPEIQDFISTFSPAAREHRAGPLYLIGQGGVTWSAVYDMALFPSKTAPVNNGQWWHPQWERDWASLSGIRDAVQERVIVDRMLALFHDEAPWIFLYFQPDFYGVSSRIDWTPRRDERIDATTARLR